MLTAMQIPLWCSADVQHNAYCKQHIYCNCTYTLFGYTNLLQACCVHPLCASLVVLPELLPVLLLLMLGAALTAASAQLLQLVQLCWQ
jgi:hypothetical protein